VSAIGTWILNAILNWLATFIASQVRKYIEEKKAKAERDKEIEVAHERIKNAQSFDEFVGAVADLGRIRNT